MSEYIGIAVSFVMAAGLTALMVVLGSTLGKKHPTPEKLAPFDPTLIESAKDRARKTMRGQPAPLAAIEAVDALEIRWPSGLVQRLEGLPINDSIRITEGEDRWSPVYRRESRTEPAQDDSFAWASSPSVEP